ncbi:Dabb family protein [Marinilongibacter aquaticus]|uniref:Dabb family protein n=1 Tax=Marinilongibacter aquaticus TaxID=2975157 RepID=UPI0021BD6BC2|nr:Dabb family protein [Marinilongibacter aquaticus]UBM58465.1 Dabb family protein [Marinilongibacter aquaticus]
MREINQGFVHTVFFWLKEKDNKAHQEGLHNGLKKLAQIDLIDQAYVGVPSTTNREVIDTTYSFSITFIFKNKADQDEYQTHPQHLEFIDNCAQYWERVRVYDAESFH